MFFTPETIIDVRERRLRTRVVLESLVRRRDLPAKDATSEGEQILQHPELELLEDKKSREGRTMMCPLP